MTIAWYGHLKFRAAPIVLTIAISWLIACPNMRCKFRPIASATTNFPRRNSKIIQEAISITVFVVFSVLSLRDFTELAHWIGHDLDAGGRWRWRSPGEIPTNTGHESAAPAEQVSR